MKTITETAKIIYVLIPICFSIQFCDTSVHIKLETFRTEDNDANP